MKPFPAILVGGPPHRGKSVLSVALLQALNARDVPMYLFRAAPDGEGNWLNELTAAHAHELRHKGEYTRNFIARAKRAIDWRIAPLLIDVGGRPKAGDLQVFEACTHAIVLSADSGERDLWRGYARDAKLQMVADLRSVLTPVDAPLYLDDEGIVCGDVSGLERQRVVDGRSLAVLVDHVAALVRIRAEELTREWLSAAPVGPKLVDLHALSKRLHPDDPKGRFVVNGDRDAVLNAAPRGEPLALFGKAPASLLAALFAERDVRWQFDMKLGWIQPPDLRVCGPGQAPVIPSVADIVLEPDGRGWRLRVRLIEKLIEMDDLNGMRLPRVPGAGSLLVDGPIPFWLGNAIVRAYRGERAVMLLQPQPRPGFVQGEE